MKCFYHRIDSDGRCSAAIVQLRYPNAKLFGINYGEKFPWSRIRKGKKVIMVDFTLQPFSEMLRLNDLADLEWYDHHISEIREAAKSNVPFKGERREGIGACQIVWENLFSDRPVPLAVKLIAQYDVWNHTDPRTLPFQYGIRLHNTYPDNLQFWANLFQNVGIVHQLIQDGRLIAKYEANKNKTYSSACFETEFFGLKCIALNIIRTNSKVFDYVRNLKQYDMMITFGWDQRQWKIKLYSIRTDIDVGIYAKQMGGGGHKQAAGFESDTLPFALC